MNICIVCGARPNFMKVAPVIRAIKADQAHGSDISCRLLYTGAPDDPTIEPSLFNDLQIAPPNDYLGVTSENLNEITGLVMQRFEQWLHDHPTDTVVVVDDLASTMAVAIVAKKQGLRLAHIAAGTRSFDIKMPKEVNRLVIDGLSDILFTAGVSNNSIANREGAELSKVYMVGNVLMDNLRFNADRLVRPALFDGDPKSGMPALKDGAYLVFTLNRKALIGDQEHLQTLVQAIADQQGDTPVVAPLRGTAAKVVEHCLKAIGAQRFFVVDPLPYLEFAYLTAHAKGIITDSGNVAEEATFNRVPCITLNSYTEHYETVKKGSNVLVGENPQLLADRVADMVNDKWKACELPEQWDGRTGERIVRILEE